MHDNNTPLLTSLHMLSNRTLMTITTIVMILHVISLSADTQLSAVEAVTAEQWEVGVNSWHHRWDANRCQCRRCPRCLDRWEPWELPTILCSVDEAPQGVDLKYPEDSGNIAFFLLKIMFCFLWKVKYLQSLLFVCYRITFAVSFQNIFTVFIYILIANASTIWIVYFWFIYF